LRTGDQPDMESGFYGDQNLGVEDTRSGPDE